ncbi:hypothetical protein [Actinophytocola sp.]|uniref:hypothetical protein n=1 Tax=Actinophytocola sp. TaxID=1872138 RepID=UPI0039C86C45
MAPTSRRRQRIDHVSFLNRIPVEPPDSTDGLLDELAPVLKEPRPIAFVGIQNLMVLVEECEDALGETVAQFLRPGPHLPERIIRTLDRSAPLRHRSETSVVQKVEPVVVVDIGKEGLHGVGSDREGATTDERVLLTTRLPVSVADNGVVRHSLNGKPNTRVRTEQLRGLGEMNGLGNLDIVVEKDNPVPAAQVREQ